MDSNVAKNTFYYKFFKLNFANNNLGIKQLLQQQLLQAIYLYRQKNNIRDNWDSILFSLPEKLILRKINRQKITTNRDFTSGSFVDDWVYRCAIAFPLANFCGVKPLEMAQELVRFFPEANLDWATKSHLKVMIKVLSTGWIDFRIELDYLGVWLQQLILELECDQGHRIGQDTCHESLQTVAEKPNLFPVNYYHARCCSLLKLGEREGLIKLYNHNFESLSWQISKPNPMIWFDAGESFLLTQPQELNLLYSILLILDHCDAMPQAKPVKEKTWLNCALNLSEAFEQFMITCHFLWRN